ncbi:lymphokine-activated killer T-cell-originated protein kinase [Serinus canaria]|uniref:lymphokine-activated killer T-cell-originated protein kinase n=1 Tax=Serinus canaria TaxID=9135 RepID=UPI0021CCB35D|nr:lymphokine-activated killer T-cell-originated protein kinase [Serinus canaria]
MIPLSHDPPDSIPTDPGIPLSPRSHDPPRCHSHDPGIPFRAVSDPSVPYVGTEPWSPPEALQPGGAISDRADVFAFGLTLWEMLALSVPHLPPPPQGGSDEEEEEEDSLGSEDSWDERAYLAALGSRPPLPPEAALEPAQAPVRELFCACTAREPRQRPPAARIVRALERDGAGTPG